ncbi:hypothetical protein GBAR_LOCUS13326 [Geodia barretti]|uniref:Uncharacterized protein n=1 Tax=Geodia barretti TaxID=519541 RepID=A0AA35WII8_GEOBA|nr:hypothetical protein GBAR_LOCUS13326 [Geodia barretti]
MARKLMLLSFSFSYLKNQRINFEAGATPHVRSYLRVRSYLHLPYKMQPCSEIEIHHRRAKVSITKYGIYKHLIRHHHHTINRQ